MSHQNKKGLEEQVHEIFEKEFCPGRKKDDDKKWGAKYYDDHHEEEGFLLTKMDCINNAIRSHIYSYNTYKDYKKHTEYFIQWVKKNYQGKDRRTIEQIRPYAEKWMQERIDAGLSPSTLKLEVSALAKM